MRPDLRGQTRVAPLGAHRARGEPDHVPAPPSHLCFVAAAASTYHQTVRALIDPGEVSMRAPRRLRYSVASSLDGYIADENGGYDWIVMDDAIDFDAFMSKIDTLVMGRATYEGTLKAGEASAPWIGIETYVVSTTLDPSEHPDVTIVSGDVEGFISDLKKKEGNDIWYDVVNRSRTS
jgi:RibD C-terminal domain